MRPWIHLLNYTRPPMHLEPIRDCLRKRGHVCHVSGSVGASEESGKWVNVVLWSGRVESAPRREPGEVQVRLTIGLGVPHLLATQVEKALGRA